MRDSGRSKRQKLKKLITNLKEESAQLNAKIDKLNDKLMTKCPHPIESLREGEYEKAGNWGSATPPMRVCTDCGYAEEGWGCGYWKLDTDYNVAVPKLSRDEAFKHVRKFLPQYKMDEIRFVRSNDTTSRSDI